MQLPSGQAKAGDGIEQLAVTKLAPRFRGEGYILRPRLMDLLGEVLEHRLTIVHAGAGYGKTSLLTQWRNALEGAGVDNVWLTLEEDEAVAATFLRHILLAIGRRRRIDEETFSSLGQFDERMPVKSLAAAFVNLLSKSGEPLVLFLDEYNRAQSDETDGLLRLLVRNIPAHIHFVIASRQRPEIDIENLRAHNDLLEVGPSDLRFSEDEVRELFNQSETDLPEPELRRLNDRTEGWPIALHMARLWLKGDGKRASMVSDFSGRTTDLTRYLTEQVLSELPDDHQDFILQTSILDGLNGDVANAVLERRDGWLLLELFHEKSLFLVPDSDDCQWFRYHTLFLDFLRDRLERHQPHRLTELHRRAAVWFAEHGMVRRAVDHALKAGDTALAGDILLEAGGWRLIMEGRIGIVRNAIAGLPTEQVDDRIGLALARMFLMIKDGDIKGARAYYDSLEPRKCDSWSTEEIRDWEICGHILSDYADDPVPFSEIERLRRLRAETPKDDHVVRAILCDSLATTYFRFGLLAASLRVCDEAIVHYRALNSLYGEVFSRLAKARVHLAEARIDEAGALLAETEDELTQRFGEGVDLSEHTSLYLAQALSERCITQDAAERLARALPVAEESDGWFELYDAAYTASAGVAWETGGIEAVLARCERACTTAAVRGLDRLAILADALAAYYLCLAGNAEAAERYVPELRSFVERELDQPSALGTYFAAILAFVEGCGGDYVEAEKRFEPLFAVVRQNGERRKLIQFTLMLAHIKARAGRTGDAARLVTQAVRDGQFTGLLRPFMELAPGLESAIGLILTGDTGLPEDRYRDSFLRDLLRDLRRKEKREAGNGPALTIGELEVLRELDHGFSNKEIARHLDISPNTVKYRLKGLYAKLSVSRRVDAVRKSREHSLLKRE